jgi:LysM repeat protein
MKKPLFVLFILFAIVSISAAQPVQLIVKSSDKGLYLEHTVTAGEGFFSVGRIYNVHPKFVAKYNDLDINKGLNIGQVILIPLTDTNFTQKKKTANPVYYTVAEKEGLLKVSNSNKKVKLQSLKEWNKLSNDNINAGSNLIVGFMVNAHIPEPVAAAPVTTDKPVVKEEVKPVIAENKPVVKEETKKPADEKIVTKTDVPVTKPEIKEEVKKPVVNEEKPIVKEEPKKTQPAPVTTNMSGQGYFKSNFDQQVKQTPVAKTETVTSGIFNTINGLQDAKYYLLINGITPGTVVRVINPDNNRTVYAKVLGEMSGYRQNQGLDIRISNLAAATLGISDMDKFIVKINY